MKIFGIPTKVEPSFFVISFFLAASRSSNLALLIEWLIVVFVSVLLHEMGHALVARKFGVEPSIKLYSMGGLTSFKSGVNLTPSQHLFISLAGPAAGFLLGGIVFVVGPTILGPDPSPLLAVTYSDLLWVNIGWGIFNLLPMLPLDGGNVLLTLGGWISKGKGPVIARVISLIVALGITAFALSLRSIWIAILGLWFAYINGSVLIENLKTRRDQNIRPVLDQARDAITKSEFDNALDLARRAQPKAHTDSMRMEAAQLVIFALIHLKRLDEAEIELTKFYGLFGEDQYLKGLFYFQKEEWAAATSHLQLAFESSPSEQVGMLLYQALVNEKSFAKALELCGHAALTEESWKLYVNLQNEAFEGNDFRTAAEAGSKAFEQQPDPNIAYNVACALARDESLSRASQIAEACQWLERAIASGFDNKELILTYSDLNSLRPPS
ncbi:MAG TPA: M50 family metallopeptidase [Pyrinomonadaceae bacterium]|nr:M50 family metallopeptidase [Pyrinomonadaceae bacterium]